MLQRLTGLRTASPRPYRRRSHMHPATHTFGAWKAPLFSMPVLVRKAEQAQALQYHLREGALTWPQ